MSTQGPLISDGAQCVAAANYFNPASALPGPNGSGQFCAVYLSAARTVSLVATQGAQMYGILQNTPTLGMAADVGIIGLSKAVAGAAIAAGAELMTNASGELITWTAGSGYFKVGQALEAAGAAEAVFLMMIYTPNYKVVT